jgi:hypothetical protein
MNGGRLGGRSIATRPGPRGSAPRYCYADHARVQAVGILAPFVGGAKPLRYPGEEVKSYETAPVGMPERVTTAIGSIPMALIRDVKPRCTGISNSCATNNGSERRAQGELHRVGHERPPLRL